MRALLVVLVAVNPPAVVAGRGGRGGAVVALAAAGAAAVAVGLAAASSALLDALDVSRPTFRLAAGVVLAAASLWWVLAGARGGPTTRPDADEPRPGTLLVLWLVALVSPQLAAVSVSLGADDGVGAVALAATAVLALTWLAGLLGGRNPVLWSAAGRVVGAFGVAVALGMVVDGVKTV